MRSYAPHNTPPNEPATTHKTVRLRLRMLEGRVRGIRLLIHLPPRRSERRIQRPRPEVGIPARDRDLERGFVGGGAPRARDLLPAPAENPVRRRSGEAEDPVQRRCGEAEDPVRRRSGGADPLAGGRLRREALARRHRAARLPERPRRCLPGCWLRTSYTHLGPKTVGRVHAFCYDWGLLCFGFGIWENFFGGLICWI